VSRKRSDWLVLFCSHSSFADCLFLKGADSSGGPKQRLSSLVLFGAPPCMGPALPLCAQQHCRQHGSMGCGNHIGGNISLWHVPGHWWPRSLLSWSGSPFSSPHPKHPTGPGHVWGGERLWPGLRLGICSSVCSLTSMCPGPCGRQGGFRSRGHWAAFLTSSQPSEAAVLDHRFSRRTRAEGPRCGPPIRSSRPRNLWKCMFLGLAHG
jgi:hypothetical protein